MFDVSRTSFFASVKFGAHAAERPTTPRVSMPLLNRRHGLALVFALAVPAGAEEANAGTIRVTANAPHAEVALDGKVVGPAPIEVAIPASGKHTLTVVEPGWSTFTRVVVRPRTQLIIEAELVDLELRTAQSAATKAAKARDKLGAALDQLLEQGIEPGSARAAKAQAALDKADAALEAAEVEVMRVMESRLPPKERAARSRETLAVAQRIQARNAATPFMCYGKKADVASWGDSRSTWTRTRQQVFCSTLATPETARKACQDAEKSDCLCTSDESKTKICLGP